MVQPLEKLQTPQWRNDAPGAPARPGGAVTGGRQIIIKMSDNFARLTALLAKVRVWFNNLTLYLNFSAIFSQIAPSKPLNQGRHWGATFCRRGAPFRRGLQHYATETPPLASPPTPFMSYPAWKEINILKSLLSLELTQCTAIHIRNPSMNRTDGAPKLQLTLGSQPPKIAKNPPYLEFSFSFSFFIIVAWWGTPGQVSTHSTSNLHLTPPLHISLHSSCPAENE